MKKTPLYNSHIKAGAKIIDFSGWAMPVQYKSIIKEHENTRNNVTVFDTSHMGEFFITGDGSLNFLQRVLTADIRKVSLNKAKYCFLLNNDGGVIDDLIVFYISEKYYMLCVNSGTIEKNLNWLNKHKNDYDVEILDVSEKTAKIDIQGPKSEQLIKKMTSEILPKRFSFINTRINGDAVLLSRTGYTGEDGFELFFEAKLAEKMWDYIFEFGKDFDIMPAGLGARDSLRLEACYPLYGHELSHDISPVEAGLNFAVDLDKVDNFIGQDKLLELKSKGIKRKLVALKLEGKGIPREGYEVYKNGENIGYISSGTFSPTFKAGIALAYIDKNCSDIGSEIEVKIRKTFHKAKVMKKPLYSFKGENVK